MFFSITGHVTKCYLITCETTPVTSEPDDATRETRSSLENKSKSNLSVCGGFLFSNKLLIFTCCM